MLEVAGIIQRDSNLIWNLYEMRLLEMFITHIMFFSWSQYLDRIGQLFFGVPPKQSSSYGGLLGKKHPCLCLTTETALHTDYEGAQIH